ncbi:MAG: transporter substrate-binding domain-containing protein [Oceanospirillaceae bacterium]
MRVHIVLLFSLLMVSSLQAQPLRIVTEEFAPYNFQVGDEAKGLSSEVVQAVLKHVKLEASIEFYPWARAYEIAQAGKNTLIYSIARIPEREALFDWVGAIAPYNTSLYKLKLNKYIKVNSIDEAKQYQIGVSLNDVTGTYLRRHDFTSLKTVSKDVLNIRLLAKNRIDLIAYEEASFVHTLQEEGLDTSLFERVYRLDELSDQLYMAFSLGSDTDLVASFKAGLKAIKMNGLYDQIQMKYLSVE